MRTPARQLTILAIALLALRIYAATRVGFGDSEALYACYALHPQLAYLDHPGLIGMFARVIGEGGAPTPLNAHVVTSALATFVPLLAAIAARAAGATWARAFVAAIALACAPEIAVGLFALTPDLLLAVGWLAALALAAWGLRAEPGTLRARASFALAGLIAGAACSAKVSALTLIPALALAYAAPSARRHARTIWPWVGLVAGLLLLAPVVLFEARLGWPMLRHRLVDTQAGAGPSLRNAGALLVGQLAYVSPLLAVAGAVVARDTWRERGKDEIASLLFFALVLPLAILVPLSLWSRVAEPHWVAPPLLALPIAWARGGRASPISRRFGIAACATALAMSLAVYAWVLLPSLARALPRSFDPRWDISSELFGWPDVVRDVKRASLPANTRDVVVVGPHWVVCAQLHAALGLGVPVGCATEIPDDFDGWTPRATWQNAAAIVFVTDSRFEVDVKTMFADRNVSDQRRVTILRGGRVSRVFSIRVLLRGGDNGTTSAPAPASP